MSEQTKNPDVKKPVLTEDSAARKDMPITCGVLDYFPLAIAEVARVSKIGNDKHNPGEPLHWAQGKSMDHADCIARHLIDRGTIGSDGVRHSAALAWRALALLQEEMEWELSRTSDAQPSYVGVDPGAPGGDRSVYTACTVQADGSLKVRAIKEVHIPKTPTDEDIARAIWGNEVARKFNAKPWPK